MKKLFFYYLFCSLFFANICYPQSSLDPNNYKWFSIPVHWTIVGNQSTIDLISLSIISAMTTYSNLQHISFSYDGDNNGSSPYSVNFIDFGNEDNLALTSRLLNKNGLYYNATTSYNSSGLIDWSFSAPYDYQYSFESDALHEIGHVLGLNDDYSNTSSVMYYKLDPGVVKTTLTSDVTSCLSSLYSGGTGVEDYLFFYYATTTFTQNSDPDYSVLFSDQPPMGDYIVGSISLSILVKHGEGEYVAATGTNGIMYFGTLPYGYYWLRDASGNVLGRVKAVGTDEKGIVHTAYCPVTISGVPQNSTSGTLTHNETWGGINNITGNVTVPSGITLKILPSSTIKFPTNVSLIINGILNALGTTFTSTSGTSAGSWGSIQLVGSGAAGSIIHYVNMQYGTEIDVTNTSNVTIQNSTIQNCTNGILDDVPKVVEI